MRALAQGLMYANITSYTWLTMQQRSSGSNVLCRSMSYDSLEDHKEDLSALLSYFDENIFADKNMEERRKLERCIKMIEQLWKNDTKDMLAREIGSDISELLTVFSGVAACQERYVHIEFLAHKSKTCIDNIFSYNMI